METELKEPLLNGHTNGHASTSSHTPPPPSRSISRLRGYLYLLLTGLAFVQAGLYASRSQHALSTSSASWLLEHAKGALLSSSVADGDDAHPITRLTDEAEEAYRAKLARQSQTLQDADAEYRRRHGGRAPPRGFDKWWAFAQENGIRLVDEYDAISRDLEPFWKLSGREFRERTKQAGTFSAIDFIKVQSGKLSAVNPRGDGDTSGRSTALMAMMDKFKQELPDMDFAINARPEPRILVPHDGRPPARGEFSPDWHGEGGVWNEYRQHCALHSAARSKYDSLRPALPGAQNQQLLSLMSGPAPEATFAPTVDALRRDYCAEPWAHHDQGLFFSDWRTIGRLLPVLSPAKAPGFGDVKVPSHYYYWPSRRHTYGFDAVNLVVREVDNMEVPWEMKSDKFFWRGPSSGGGANPPGHAARYQRHRLVRTTDYNSTATTTVVFSNSTTYGTQYFAAQVPLKELNQEVTDVAFVKAVYESNYPGGEKGLRKDHRFENEAVELGTHWRHKYLLDLDGNGYSGKFMALMESESAVVKATIFEEFWADWLQPWLHFIPLSSGYRELYNIHSYFSGPTNATLTAANITGPVSSAQGGDVRLRRIARAGKHWRRTVVRNVDMEAYMYRLCLEYARLWADDRDSMNFIL